ncbi:MAG: hypothetical protein V3U76_13910 [Granulosicoccus sp.]
MTKTLLAITIAAALAACSSDGDNNGSNSNSGSGSDGGDTNPGGGTTTVTPSGEVPGIWIGNNGFGDAIVVIEEDLDIFSYSASSAGTYETVFGKLGGAPAERFIHRNSDNPAHGDSFTLVGDLPTELDPGDSDTISYNLAVSNDGEQLDNTGTAFSLAFARTDDVQAITVADIAGDWRALTSFATENGDLELAMSFATDGAVSGHTYFNSEFQIEITSGTVSAVTSSPQYLAITFEWNGTSRIGVITRDRSSNRLLLNSFGPDADGNKSFSALLTPQ